MKGYLTWPHTVFPWTAKIDINELKEFTQYSFENKQHEKITKSIILLLRYNGQQF